MSRRRAHQNRAGVGPALATRESLQTNIAPVLCSRDFTERTQLFDGHCEEVREGQITPEGSRYQPRRGRLQALDRGYANFLELRVCEVRILGILRSSLSAHRASTGPGYPSGCPGPSPYLRAIWPTWGMRWPP